MAGAGYKLFNTGDVLTAAQVNTYLMEQTVMVFADAAARTAALSGVVSEGMISYLKDTNAVEVYNGSAWVASDDPNAIQNTIVDAKGDLITATAADTPSRIAVGNNGETLVADSSASTGLRWQSNFAAGKNKIINGDFNIWQRGTSFTPAATTDGLYDADRMTTFWTGTGTTTVSRQNFTPGSAPVSGYESAFFKRIALSSGASYFSTTQRIEDVRTLAGQTVTFSYWAKATSSVGGSIFFRQNFGSGGSAEVDTTIAFNITSTSWTRYTHTVTLPSISGKTIGTNSYFSIIFVQSNGTVASNTVDLWGWQLEAGNTATAFQTATGTLAGELAACQRYYYRQTAPSGTVYTRFSTYAPADNTTQVSVLVQTPVTMRIVPTVLEYANLTLYGGSFGTLSTASISVDSSPNLVQIGVNGSGLTQFRPYAILANNTANAYLGLSAEL